MTVGIGAVVLGRWRIVAHLGGGGMGDVWRIEALDSPISAALKTIKTELDEEDRRRFFREAKLMEVIQHPCVVGLHEVGFLDDGAPCIVMDLVDGESLQGRLERVGALPWKIAVAATIDVLNGLAAAHSRSVVHRDIKPANILVERAPPHRCRVADFGIARSFDGSMSKITATGVVAGTVDYMSPEHLQGHALNGRSDIYAMGLVLWQMLTGRMPFDDLVGVARALRRCVANPPLPIAPASMPPVPADLAHAVFLMLERESSRRPTAEGAIALLRAIDEHNGQGFGPSVASVETEAAMAPLAAPARSAPSAPHRPTAPPPSAPQAVPLNFLADEAVEALPSMSLVVARLPASRLAMTSERRWLSATAQPASAFSLGAFWFVSVPHERVGPIVEALQVRYGTTVRIHVDTLTAELRLTGAAALGSGSLPPSLARAIETLSRDP